MLLRRAKRNLTGSSVPKADDHYSNDVKERNFLIIMRWINILDSSMILPC